MDLDVFPWNPMPSTSTVEKKVGIWGEPICVVLYVGLEKPSDKIHPEQVGCKSRFNYNFFFFGQVNYNYFNADKT